MMLDIGCGLSKREDSIGIDLRKVGSVDILADAHSLPFKNETFDHVYSSHTIEHFSHKETGKILTEWTRVLKSGGIIEIRCPDLRIRALLFFLNPSWKNVEHIYGEQNYVGGEHRCGFSYGLLKKSLESIGIKHVKRIITGYKGIPFIPDCLHIKGVKG